MKKLVLLLVLAAVAAGYYYRKDLIARAPAWLQAEAAKLDPSLAPAKTAATPKASGGGHRGGPVAVKVAVATSGRLPVLRSTIGTVVAVDSTELAPEISGTVAKILVKNGADVKAGELLIQLDDRTIRAQIAKDAAQIAKDQATLDNAKATYDRTKHLVQTGVSAVQAGDDAMAAVKVAEGTLAVDQAAHKVDAVALSNTEIRAPFDGRLGAVQFSTGAYVSAGTALVRITRMKPVLVAFSLPVSDLPLLRRTKAAGTLTVGVSPVLSQADTSKQETGPVSFINNAVNTGSATVDLRASLGNDSDALWPGQPVNVQVRAGTTGPLVLVPNVAVMPHVNGAVVYVVKADWTVESRPVTVALREGAQAGLSAGLKAGETVVTEGQAAVLPGAKVRVVTSKAAAGAGGAAAGKRGQADLNAESDRSVSKS